MSHWVNKVALLVCEDLETQGSRLLSKQTHLLQAGSLSLLPGPTVCKERTNSHKLSSDFHTYTPKRAHVCSHVCVPIYTHNKQCL